MAVHQRKRVRVNAGVAIETLEDRRLLSASLGGIGAAIAPTLATAVVTSSVKSYGVTLNLSAGQSFNGYLGTLIGTQVNTNNNKISASIDWGDNTQASQGVVSIGKSGNINVGGAHTYAAAGDYSVKITVSAAPIPIPGEPTPQYILLLGTVTNKAIVRRAPLSLTGTLKGTYKLAPTIPDIGAAYVFTGSGDAGAMGAVTVGGTIRLPGFILKGSASGTLTLTKVSATAKGSGSVSLNVTGPAEAGFGPFPTKLAYVITGGTGAFAGASGSGTIDVALGSAGETFTFKTVSN